jgi:hypothetical protein
MMEMTPNRILAAETALGTLNPRPTPTLSRRWSG